ncbi:MAG: hypothetical protein ACKV22_31200 [Bryobacteraceae bacterium]
MRVLLGLCAVSLMAQTLDIGTETQLFLDDYAVDRVSGLTRSLHSPVKKGLIQDEKGGDFGIGGVYVGNLVTRDNRGRFHMMYRFPWDDPGVRDLHPSIGEDKAHWFRESAAYAYSNDGVRWVKPKLGLIDGPSALRREGPYLVAASMSKDNNLGCGIDFAMDLHEHGGLRDPKRRYLLRYSRKDDTHPFAKLVESQMYYAAEWPDVVHDPNWRQKLEPIPGARMSPRGYSRIAGYDEQARVWWSSAQDFLGKWTKRPEHSREIARWESPDLVTWSKEKLVLPLQPDESKDPRDYIEYMDLEPYRVGGPKTGAWLGQLIIFHSDRTSEAYRMPRKYIVWRKGLTALRLVISRDAGNSWQRVGGMKEWLSPHREEHGYDRLVFGQYPIRVGDELWLYYTAWDGDHLVYNFDGSTYYKDGFLRKTRIARATLRWNGYMSLDGSGEVVSKPLVFAGNSLAVNARGEVRAELQGLDGKPIPGFSVKDCIPAKGDGVSLPIRWKKADLSEWSGKPVRLRLVTKSASLYSFQFQ